MASFELRWVRRGPQDERFPAGRALLRELVSELTGQPADEVRITASCPDCDSPHGRPAVEGSPLHVGLSHTATATVAVASWAGPVGVDAEELPGSSAAIEAVEVLTGVADLRHWTRVESVLKADGRGLRVDPAAVRIHDSGAAATASIGGGAARYVLSQPFVDGGLVVTVASLL